MQKYLENFKSGIAFSIPCKLKEPQARQHNLKPYTQDKVLWNVDSR